jgi:thiamine biosynthesis lipoprotein
VTHTASVSFPALGSTAVVAVADAGRLEPAREAVQRVVEDIDLACSRFRSDSELSHLNAGAGSAIEVGPLLLESVLAALRAARLTDGDVDPTVGRALIALGYDRDFARLTEAGSQRPASFARVPGWRTVAVDSSRSTIRIPLGVQLDLGSTAKALAADHAARDAYLATNCGVLVGLGGDFASAGLPPAQGWRIRVTDDHRAGTDAPGQWIALRSGGLATSSTTVRRWRAGGATAHHLVDPRTGAPARVVWRTVSVTAASCLDANIASTAAVIRGERAEPWLAGLGLPSRLVRVDGTVVHLAGWPADGDDLEVVPATQEPTGSAA